jgi:hypothetical protein
MTHAITPPTLIMFAWIGGFLGGLVVGSGITVRRDRPTFKPPSLKEQAYAALDTYIYGNPDHSDKQNTYNIIRRALEQLDD